MTVILDTTVYHSDPYFKGTDMIKLRQLCKDGKVHLVIPQIVHDEYKSQEEEKFINLVREVLKKLQIRGDKSTCEEEKKILKDLQDDAKKMLEKCEKSIEIKIESFIQETNATRKPLTLDEYNEAFSRYFQGEKPYSDIKSRKDIPDALTFMQVKNHKGDDVVFISNDKNLRESIKGLGITTYSKLSEFIESDTIKSVIDFKSTDEFLLKYFTEKFDVSNKNVVASIEQSIEKELGYKQFTDNDIPDDNNEGTITGVNCIDKIEIKNDEILNLGNGLFSIPFSCEINANVEYYIFKADYCCLDEDRIKDIYIEDWNDHYFQAEEEFTLSCTGKIGIQYNIDISEMVDLNNLMIDELLNDIDVSFSDLEIAVV